MSPCSVMLDGSSLEQSAGGSGGATLRPALNHRSDEDDSPNEEAGDVSGGRRRRRREAERSATRSSSGNNQRSPTGEKIAKDTGCCLYSAISVVVVMLVSLGIVLIVTGPVLGLSIFPPLFKQHPPVQQQQQLEHNHLYNINDSLHNNESVSQAANEPHQDVIDNENYEWLTINYQSTEESVTDANSNETAAEVATEDLENLSPEALRLNRKGYVAYVPIPLDDHVEIDDHIGSSRERLDWINTGEDVVTRTGFDYSNSRRRPESNNDKLLLPIVIVPHDNGQGAESQSPSWRTNHFANANTRNGMTGNRQLDDENDDEYHPNSGSIPLPTSNQHLFRRPLHSEEDTDDDESADPVDNLYRMFGTLAPEQRNGRPRNGGNNNRHRDDYGQRARLPPPPRSRRPPPRRLNGKGGRRGGGPPPRQIRPPPKQPLPSLEEQSHRITSRYPQNNWGPAVDYTDPQGYQQQQERPANGGLRNERIRKTKPLYSYPSDAMSIQDIINYMTAMGNSETSDSGKSVHDSSTNRQHTNSGYRTTLHDIDPSIVYQIQKSQRSGHGHGHSPIGRPINTGSRQQQQPALSAASPALRNQQSQPYSFMLDVYPVKDATGTLSGGGRGSSTHLLGATSGATIVLPPSPPAHRQQLQQQQQQQQQYISNSQNYHNYNSAEEPHSFRSQPLQPEVYRRPSFNQQQQQHQQYSSHLAPTADDHLLLPVPYRPTARPQLRAPPSDDPANKPKLVVHLNVYNQKGQAANNNPRYYSEERYDDDADDVYYSPSDVYRAVLRNNAAKRDQYLQAGDDMGGIGIGGSYNRADDGLSGGQSRIGGITHRITNEDVAQPSLSLSSGVLHHDVGTFRNHQMDDHQMYDSNEQQHNNNNNNKQNFYNSRNFYPNDDIPEPLPSPMALTADETAASSSANGNSTTSEAPTSTEKVSASSTSAEGSF